MIKKITLLLSILLSGSMANASFYIDYQGLERKKTEALVQKHLISPDGYRLLTNELKGIIFEIGPREQINKTSLFADDLTMKDGIGILIPKGWSAYISEEMSGNKNISFLAENESWLDVLARIGNDYGFKFVVDWQQMMVQISKDEFYVEPDPNAPTIVEGDNGQMYYIYKSKQSIDKGMMIINGEMVPLKISQ